MNKTCLKKLQPLIFLVAGGTAYALRSQMVQELMDYRGLMVRGSLTEILLWVLTGAAAVCALLVAKNLTAESTGGRRYVSALGCLVFAAGIYTLLAVPAKGPAPLVNLYRVFSWAAIASLAVAAVLNVLGKKALFVPELIVTVFTVLHLVECYQLWSERPELLRYIFGVGAILCIVLHAYHRMARSADLKLKFTAPAVSMLGIYFCLAVQTQGCDYPAFFIAAAIWMTAELIDLIGQPQEAAAPQEVPETAAEEAEVPQENA